LTARRDVEERVEHMVRALGQYLAGVHSLGAPAYLLDSELPEGLAAVYRAFDGGDLFHETVCLVPSSELEEIEDGWLVGSVAGHSLRVARDGTVWIFDSDIEDELEDGSSFDRWLYGMIEAESVVHERDGEFRDDVALASGELKDEVELERLRAQVKRDKKALGPRWKLARRLHGQGDPQRSRDLLEEVVADRPDFAWAWFDLSRISERLQEWPSARDEAVMAADASASSDARGYFLAQAAHFAACAGDDAGRAELASRAVAADPLFVARSLEGLRSELDGGDEPSARQLWSVVYAVAPRHLEVLELKDRLGGGEPQS